MKLLKLFLSLLIVAVALPIAAQAPAFEEMEFEPDSVTTPYKPAGKNYVFIRSKRGTGGLTKTSKGDSIKAFPVTDIVLVFSELNSGAIADREEANKERWENLLKTYPEYFQFSTLYKNMCQCKNNGDTATFKPTQGFYVYFTGKDPPPPVVEKKVEEKNVSTELNTKKTKVEEKVIETKKTKEASTKLSTKEEKEVVKETPTKEKDTSTKLNKKEEKDASTKLSKKEEKEEEDTAPTTPGVEQTLTLSETDLGKANTKKKAGYSKPKKAKDPKACRPPCYENGDDDLNKFFVENIPLSKKQKRHGKRLESTVRLQLNFDGSIKKAIITGEDEELNKQVQSAIGMMNLWNPAVRNGVTVRSEVKMLLKYDKETKGMKPFETMITPRPAPKCKCMSDEEIFGS